MALDDTGQTEAPQASATSTSSKKANKGVGRGNYPRKPKTVDAGVVTAKPVKAPPAKQVATATSPAAPVARAPQPQPEPQPERTPSPNQAIAAPALRPVRGYESLPIPPRAAERALRIEARRKALKAIMDDQMRSYHAAMADLGVQGDQLHINTLRALGIDPGSAGESTIDIRRGIMHIRPR
jgi:hypothetical protein